MRPMSTFFDIQLSNSRVYLRDDMNFFDIIVSSQNTKCKKEGAV